MSTRTRNSLRSTLGLTDLEWEILHHRLEVPDCIADALEDQFDPDDVEDVVAALAVGDLYAALGMNEALVSAILTDCVEGSTYYGASLGQSSVYIEVSVQRAGERLAAKVGAYLDQELVYPCG